MKKYTIIVRDATVAFAEKKGNVYNLMYRGSTYGYQKLQANVSMVNNLPVITLGRLTITTYKEGDFSNCQKFSPTGKCLSCDSNS